MSDLLLLRFIFCLSINNKPAIMIRKAFFPAAIISLLTLFASIAPSVYGYAPDRNYFQIKIYSLKSKEQEERIDKYLQQAFLPALHRAGISKVGVFKSVENDTAAIRRVFVFIPFKSLDQFSKISQTLAKDAQFLADGKDYT